MKQGAKANKTGNQLELFIDNLLRQNGYTFVKSDIFPSQSNSNVSIYTRQYFVGLSIYGHKQKCDFLLYHKEKHPNRLSIEAKWQEKPGSVDEKFPFLVENLKLRECDTIIVLDGGGYKKGAEKWLRRQVDRKNRLVGVFSMQEFQKYSNSGAL